MGEKAVAGDPPNPPRERRVSGGSSILINGVEIAALSGCVAIRILG